MAYIGEAFMDRIGIKGTAGIGCRGEENKGGDGTDVKRQSWTVRVVKGK